ncbi:MAG: class I SAM-dependent methyltransferase [Verrucomicrobiales bacterium]
MDAQIKTAKRIRKGLIASDTDAYRIFDGAGDGQEGVFIDTFAGHWLVSHRGDCPDAVCLSGLKRESLWLKRLDRDCKGLAQCVEGNFENHRITIMENGVAFKIDFAAGYSQGIFLDQRDNRREVACRAPGQRILNCFAYTCGFSVAAALAGAQSTTSIDLSRSYLQWGKLNFELNGIELSSSEHYFCRGDVFEWLNQFFRKKRRFGGVILDPPSFSRDKQGTVFNVEKDYPRLVAAAARLVVPGGWILACCNHHGIDDLRFNDLLGGGMASSGREVISRELRRMPPDFNGEQYLKSAWIEIR